MEEDTAKPAPEPYSHLTIAQHRTLILRQTEPPNSSALPSLSVQASRGGSSSRATSTPSVASAYTCANCSSPLFFPSSKFASGTGWPSFSSAVPGAVRTKTDWRLREAGRWVLGGRLGLKFREEACCASCGGHLGHVFRGEKWDGVEEETKGKGVTRYCINGCSLSSRFHDTDASAYGSLSRLDPEG
ncbi:Thioredoxin [Dactylella cylindrospora]|nr:Thioredoxin [Dactylella cylindrospora]